MDTTKITHDNNGRFYRIKMDIAKEGSALWDLTPYFKGRVGDNRFGLQVTWTYQGRIMDVTGMKPYIAGNVGNYSFDDKKNLALAPDAGTVHYVGSPNDCQSGGRVTYYFPEQMFPKDGIFKGYIGLIDDRDDSAQPHISGVTIWFKVLPGIAQMGHACDVYISELDKTLQRFKETLRQHNIDYQDKLQQVIDDARNKYLELTKESHDAAFAAQKEIDAVRANNNNLADTIQSILNNIKANNIVTKPEYDKLANELVNRLSQINTKPDYYDNYASMITANPQGTQNLCVTADIEHKWLYVNGQWLDLGNFSYADISPALKNNLYQKDHANVLINPDLRNSAYGWNIDVKWEKDPTHAIGNSMAYGCYMPDEKTAVSQSIFQKDIKVERRTKLSCGILVNTNQALTGKVQLLFRDANNEIIKDAVHTVSVSVNTYNAYEMVKIENITIPNNAVTCAFTALLDSTGLLIVCRPQINFESTLLPYDEKELRNDLSYNSSNALMNPNLRNSAYGWNIDVKWEKDPTHAIGNSMAYGCYMPDEKTAVSQSIFQKDIKVERRTKLSCGILVNTNQALTGKVQLLFRDANNEIIKDAVHTVSVPVNTYNAYEMVKIENITIPNNAVTCAFTALLDSTGLLIVCRPQINFESTLLPYDEKVIKESLDDLIENQKHILPYFDFSINKNAIQDKWVKASFEYHNKDLIKKGFTQIAIQGDSSRAYPKKNYKIKLFSDSKYENKFKIKLKSTWAKLNKYNLKANWIDATQSRNLVNAKLIADATAETKFQDRDIENKLSKSQNYGQMEGFPVELYFNGAYAGLYSCNTKKMDSIFGMNDKDEGTGVISILDNPKAPNSQLLKIPTAKLDNVAYKDELHDTPNKELVNNWSIWLDFLNNSTDEDFKNKLSIYIDVKALINIYLFGVMSREYDYFSKSILFLTLNNGKSYYPVAYDLDSNWGQDVTGKIEGNPQDEQWGFSTETASGKDGKYISNVGWNKLFERLFKLFKPEIKKQYCFLRKNVWSNSKILNSFKKYMNTIPESALEKDQTLWNNIP